MDDRTFKRQRKRVRKLTERWRNRLGLGYLRQFELRYDRDGDHLREIGHAGATAMTHVMWSYKDVVITWDLSSVKDMNDVELEYAVLHELMHIFIQQVVEPFADQDQITGMQSACVERTATDLAQAFLWIRDFAAEGKMGPAVTADPDGGKLGKRKAPK